MAEFRTPLDLAGQVTWAAWSLHESPSQAEQVDPIVRQALALGGIKEFTNLRYRKAAGKPVFGQIPNYPRGDADQTAELLYQIDQYLSHLPAIKVPSGDRVPAGLNQPSDETYPAANWQLGDVYYQAPYQGEESITVHALAIDQDAVVELGQSVLLDLN